MERMKEFPLSARFFLAGLITTAIYYELPRLLTGQAILLAAGLLLPILPESFPVAVHLTGLVSSLFFGALVLYLMRRRLPAKADADRGSVLNSKVGLYVVATLGGFLYHLFFSSLYFF